MFRSEDMRLNYLMFAKESMWETMNHLAYTEKAMFVPHHHHKTKSLSTLALYANKVVKQTDELLHCISDIENKMREFDWPISEYRKSASEYMRELDLYCYEEHIEGSKLYYKIEGELVKKHRQLIEYTENYSRILDQRVILLEQMAAIRVIEDLIPVEFQNFTTNNNINYYNDGNRYAKQARGDKKFHSLLGLIPTEKLHQLQKLLFRISRENIILKSKTINELNDPLLKDKSQVTQKTMIFVLFPRTEKEVIIQKVDIILKNFNFMPLELPPYGQKPDVLLSLREDLEDNRKILTKTQNEINVILQDFSSPAMISWLSYINVIKLIVKREQYFVRNLLFVEEKDGFYQLLVWVPVSCNEELRNDLEEIRMSDSTFIKPKLIEINRGRQLDLVYKPPTFFHQNTFTQTFQLIVDTYGVPRYKEANPGLFTIVTFPFMFGLMFGDVGHGSLLLVMSFFVSSLMGVENTSLAGIKYMLLLMGIFSIFCGFIYNDFFSIPLILFDSCYTLPSEDSAPFNRIDYECTYPFGIDWIWAQSSNDTSFINSFKMKFSIIVGVTQMLFGTLLKASNSSFFKNGVDFWFEALPQFVFMSVTFGYMCFCIIIKWLQDWTGRQPISIIQLFINFTTVDEALYGTPELQKTIQTCFMIAAIISIFMMLIPKPFIVYLRDTPDRSLSRINNDESDMEQRNSLMGSVS